MNINKDNYELYLFQYQEGMLSSSEREEVEQFLRQHPDLAEEMQFYDPTLKISEVEPVLFPDKESLKHTTVALAPRSHSHRWMAIAASIAALLGIGLFFTYRPTSTPNEGETMVVAHNVPPTIAPASNKEVAPLSEPTTTTTPLPTTPQRILHRVASPTLDPQSTPTNADALATIGESDAEEVFSIQETNTFEPTPNTLAAKKEEDETVIYTNQLVRYEEDSLVTTIITDQLVTISEEYRNGRQPQWAKTLYRRIEQRDERQMLTLQRERRASNWNEINWLFRLGPYSTELKDNY